MQGKQVFREWMSRTGNDTQWLGLTTCQSPNTPADQQSDTAEASRIMRLLWLDLVAGLPLTDV